MQSRAAKVPVLSLTSPAPAPIRRAGLQPALWLLALSLAGVALFIAAELLEGDSFGFDRTILQALRQPGHPDIPIGPAWLEQSAVDISAMGGFTLITLFGGFGVAFLLALRRRMEAGWIGIALVGATLLSAGLKQWLHRPRPELVPHLARVTSLSFPSGHAMVSSAVYLTLAIMLGEAKPALRRYFVGLAVTLVVLIGCTRIYLGVHWPSDVLAGWALGSAWALAVYALKHRIGAQDPVSAQQFTKR